MGDIESAPFIEAMRQLKRRAGKGNFLQIHVSLIPVIQGEQKTKPTQQAIRDVGRAGLVPDLVSASLVERALLMRSDCVPLRCASRKKYHRKGRHVLSS